MEALYKSPLFEGLDQHTIDCLLDHNCRVRKYPPGEPVALQGDVYKELVIVDKGLLRTEMTDAEGTRVTLEEIIEQSGLSDDIIGRFLSGGNTNVYNLLDLMEQFNLEF